MSLVADYAGRHRSVLDVLRWFECDHLTGPARTVSSIFKRTACVLMDELPDSAELTKCLNDLLTAKDWAVRARIAS